MVPAFHQSCSEVVGKWDKLVSEKGSSCEVDVWPWLVISSNNPADRAIHKEIKLGDLTLPGGVEINVPIMLVQRDTELWANAAAEFMRDSKTVSQRHKEPSLLLSVCVGLIQQRFSFELFPFYVHVPDLVFTLHPQFGAHLIMPKPYSYNG
ncbi:unnamed protein product [Microthlaspi erraticum]|uniref:Uncharacterized protein n=1 Tax=Microthlaspi erraticum TaxID=1685480 RepID=A0A6D2IPX0_9BRAS|nr:unnamed protein product [Microthlaspi erraticum]